MPNGDRPSDLNQTSPTRAGTNVAGPDLRGRPEASPPDEQEPEVETSRRIRDVALRPYSWMRERPAMALSLIGGLAVIGVGTWLALRSRRRTRWEMLRDRGEDVYDWLRAKGNWVRSKL